MHLQPGAIGILQGFGNIVKPYILSLSPKVMSMKCMSSATSLHLASSKHDAINWDERKWKPVILMNVRK